MSQIPTRCRSRPRPPPQLIWLLLEYPWAKREVVFTVGGTEVPPPGTQARTYQMQHNSNTIQSLVERLLLYWSDLRARNRTPKQAKRARIRVPQRVA
jgi:hypothetical protein